METSNIVIDRVKARELYQTYKKHAHYSEPIDAELQRAYQLLAQGKLVIRALESIKLAGLDEKNYPKLAIARATAKHAFCSINDDGGCHFADTQQAMWRGKAARSLISLPAGTFTAGLPYRNRPQSAKAMMPYIPAHLRPKRGLDNYHVLWEAEWTPTPPIDPFLLRRIGKADLWLVVGAWELTEVERACLSTRVNAQ